MKPQIVIEDYKGVHNTLPETNERLVRSAAYKDCSTICIVPTRGVIPAKVVQNWMGMLPMMNQKFIRIFMIGMEVGEAYSQCIEMILTHPDLQNWKYILTLEEDNMPPPDGVIKLVESIQHEYSAVGGLYWTKGEGGQPMIYGDPAVMPRNFIPQIPRVDTLQECNGLGMGFTLFKISMFKDKRLPRPLFRTVSEIVPNKGGQTFTQDLWFFNNALPLGYKFACDTRVKVGHYDIDRDIVW